MQFCLEEAGEWEGSREMEMTAEEPGALPYPSGKVLALQVGDVPPQHTVGWEAEGSTASSRLPQVCGLGRIHPSMVSCRLPWATTPRFFCSTAADIACQSCHRLVLTDGALSKARAGLEHCYLATSARSVNEVAWRALLQGEESSI